jgi:hypothetical protein
MYEAERVWRSSVASVSAMRPWSYDFYAMRQRVFCLLASLVWAWTYA